MGDDRAGDEDRVVADEERPDEPPRSDGGSTDPPRGSQLESPSAQSDGDTVPSDVVPTFEDPEASPDQAEAASVLDDEIFPEFVEPEPLIGDPIIPTFEETTDNGLLPSKPAPETITSEPDDDLDFGISGPEYDEEMPLADHIEEMIKRLAVVVVVAGSVTLVTFPFAEQIIVHLWYAMLPGGADPRIYHPLEFLLTQIKVASLMGIIVAIPILVYETYAFMRPGLYQNERRYYLAAIPTSLVLAVVGVAFAYFIVLPAIFTYFMTYSQDAGEIAFALGQTFELILVLMAYLAIVFQIPLFIMLAIMMGLTTRQWLADMRLYFWGAFLGLSFLTSPDPTGMAPIIIALTMVALFEGTLAILKWVGR